MGGAFGGALAGGIGGAVSSAIGSAISGGSVSAIIQSATVGGLAGAGIVGPLGLATGDFTAGVNVGIGAEWGAWAGFMGGLFGQIGNVFVDPESAYGNSIKESPCN